MNCSTPGSSVLHYLPGFAQIMSVESVMLSNHLILCCPLFLLPSISPSIRVFSNESALCIRWPKYWRFSFSISPFNEYSGLTSFRTDWFDLHAVQGTLKSLLQHHSLKHQFSNQSVKPHPQTGLPAASVNARTMFPVLQVKNLWVKTHISPWKTLLTLSLRCMRHIQNLIVLITSKQ